MITEYPSLEDFMKMDDKEVAALVSSSPVGEAGTLLVDGNRRAGMLFYGLDPQDEDFNKKAQEILHPQLLRVTKTFFDNGVRALFLPLVSQRNFARGKAYIEASINYGLRYVFHDPKWLSFYKENSIRVQCYGDRKFVEQGGGILLLDMMQEIEEKTSDNTGATLFLGFACDRSMEEIRLSLIGIDSYGRLGRPPTRAELIREYFGMDAPDVGFCVRLVEVRDSDLQPILVTGPKTQMYFPVTPLTFISERTIRYILYDLVVSRIASKGMRMYSEEDTEKADITRMKEYYELNRDAVLGLGTREGPFWIPKSQIRMPTDHLFQKDE